LNQFDTIATAAAAIDLFGALLFSLAYVRRRADKENAVAAVLCVAAAAHATGWLAASHASGVAALPAAVAASFGLVVALPTMTHFALLYAGIRPSGRAFASLYALAAGCALLDVFVLHSFPAGAGGGAHYTTVLGCFGIATSLGGATASVTVLVVVGRVYLAGRKEALAMVMAATGLLATVINDVAVAAGLLRAGYFIDAGLAGMVVAIMTTRSARYVVATRELELRTKELRTRTGELRRSYEELRTAQEELVKKEQLAVVGELAAVIAHEVRNPLAIIANAVAGLRKQAISRQDHETLLGILDEETSRLNRLVTDLLRYARPVNVQRSDFSLVDVLDRALSLVTKDRKGIHAELKVDGHEGRIWGDPNLLRQVFDNLVVNAVQAMGTGGTLTVCIRAAIENGTYGVAVDIIDTGEGMDSQVRSRARDPFFTTRPSGTGLGLAIVDRIVDAHGGYLAIDSRAGEGTTVTVFLPERSQNEPAAPRSRSAKSASEMPGPAGAAR
jgi:signal transduction histidine kinase